MSTFLTSVFAHDARSVCHVLLFNLHRNDKTSTYHSLTSNRLFVQKLSSVVLMSSSATTPCVSFTCGCVMAKMTAEITLMKTRRCAVIHLSISFLELKINFLMLYVVSVWVSALQKIADAQMQHETYCNILFSFL